MGNPPQVTNPFIIPLNFIFNWSFTTSFQFIIALSCLLYFSSHPFFCFYNLNEARYKYWFLHRFIKMIALSIKNMCHVRTNAIDYLFVRLPIPLLFSLLCSIFMVCLRFLVNFLFVSISWIIHCILFIHIPSIWLPFIIVANRLLLC